jgi:hypothetical protein
MIQVNSIEIPCDIQRLCADWHGGMDDMLYAVSSTGGLTMGTIRPEGCDTDEKWYLTIWRELSSDLGHVAVMAFKDSDVDSYELECAESWADDVCGTLAESYGLENWDACDDR